MWRSEAAGLSGPDNFSSDAVRYPSAMPSYEWQEPVHVFAPKQMVKVSRPGTSSGFSAVRLRAMASSGDTVGPSLTSMGVVRSLREAGVGSTLLARRLSDHDPAEVGGSAVRAVRVLPHQGPFVRREWCVRCGLWGGLLSKHP